MEEKNLENQQEESQQEESSFLENMLDVANMGEELIDPNTGKHDDAVLSAVVMEGASDNPYLTLTWSGLIDSTGKSFEQKDRLFTVRADSHPIAKSRFMQKLKGLGVVKPDFKHVLYFDPSSISKLEDALIRKIGESFNLTISKDKRDFYQVAIRK